MYVVTKSDLIAILGDTPALTRAAARTVLEGLAARVRQELRAGNEIVLPGIGTLLPKKRAARMGRNPHTGEAIPIPAHRIAKFRPAKALKDALNDG